ncbi:MAG: hypothetical protein K0S74_644 [Chlamydiales bacterium]|jgi:hypothetical protein|nr:hypothetical protein [Chlamydiales bacterium]
MQNIITTNNCIAADSMGADNLKDGPTSISSARPRALSNVKSLIDQFEKSIREHVNDYSEEQYSCSWPNNQRRIAYKKRIISLKQIKTSDRRLSINLSVKNPYPYTLRKVQSDAVLPGFNHLCDELQIEYRNYNPIPGPSSSPEVSSSEFSNAAVKKTPLSRSCDHKNDKENSSPIVNIPARLPSHYTISTETALQSKSHSVTERILSASSQNKAEQSTKPRSYTVTEVKKNSLLELSSQARKIRGLDNLKRLVDGFYSYLSHELLHKKLYWNEQTGHFSIKSHSKAFHSVRKPGLSSYTTLQKILDILQAFLKLYIEPSNIELCLTEKDTEFLNGTFQILETPNAWPARVMEAYPKLKNQQTKLKEWMHGARKYIQEKQVLTANKDELERQFDEFILKSLPSSPSLRETLNSKKGIRIGRGHSIEEPFTIEGVTKEEFLRLAIGNVSNQREVFLDTFRSFYSPSKCIKTTIDIYKTLQTDQEIKQVSSFLQEWNLTLSDAERVKPNYNKQIASKAYLNALYAVDSHVSPEDARITRYSQLGKDIRTYFGPSSLSPDCQLEIYRKKAQNILTNHTNRSNRTEQFLDFNFAAEFALQLVAQKYRLLTQIRREEFTSKAQSPTKRLKKSPNLFKAIEHSNKLSNALKVGILLNSQNLIQFERGVKFLLGVMLEVEKWGDYDTLFCLYGVINSITISKLLNALSNEKLKEQARYYDTLFNNTKNSKVLREKYKELQDNKQPCIVSLALVLKDLTFVDEGNQQSLTNEQQGKKELLDSSEKVELINLEKQRMISTTVKQIRKVSECQKYHDLALNIHFYNEIDSFWLPILPDEFDLMLIAKGLELMPVPRSPRFRLPTKS